jgi:hypothetical protein
MIIHDLFFDSGSTEAAKIKKILQRYVIYISDHITVTYLNIETGNRRLNIGGWYVFARRKGLRNTLCVLNNVVPLLPELVGSAQLITECGKILYNSVSDSLTMFIVFIN